MARPRKKTEEEQPQEVEAVEETPEAEAPAAEEKPKKRTPRKKKEDAAPAEPAAEESPAEEPAAEEAPAEQPEPEPAPAGEPPVEVAAEIADLTPSVEEEANAEAETPVEEPVAEATAEEEAPAEEASADAEPVGEMPAPPASRQKKKRLPRSQRRQRTKPKRERPKTRAPIVRLPKPEHARGRRKERRGVVVSSEMDKTIVVRVDALKPHPVYKKIVRRSRKFHAHDETNVAKAGDVVRIVETRPVSKTKSWRLAEVLEEAK